MQKAASDVTDTLIAIVLQDAEYLSILVARIIQIEGCHILFCLYLSHFCRNKGAE
jgi:hypothetical protein